MRKVTLVTPLKSIDEMHQALQTRAKTAQINVDALQKLLIDHTAMYNVLKANNLTVVEPKEINRERL